MIRRVRCNSHRGDGICRDESFLFICSSSAQPSSLPSRRFIFIAIREAVKRQRQEIVRDLAAVFDIAGPSSQRLIPSFEFVKYKYFVGRPKLFRKSGIGPIHRSAISGYF